MRALQDYSWPWVQEQVAQTIDIWHQVARSSGLGGPRYSLKEQLAREKAYDHALRAVEREVSEPPRNQLERLQSKDRITASFARFSATALGLEDEAIRLLTDEFLPMGTAVARWARQFDATLSMTDIVQACRNAWTVGGLQPLLGDSTGITPSILGYSLLYPYSDNYLDRPDVTPREKLGFSERFRLRLRGEELFPLDALEASTWTMVKLIEDEYPREAYPQVFACLLAIHRAQEESIAQLNCDARCADPEILRITCAKGGCSVLADACLAHGSLTGKESLFSFQWGALLQLGDDLQDVREDMLRGSVTLFSRAAASGKPLDALLTQLLAFSEFVGAQMDDLPSGTSELKDLLRMSWRSLIVGAVAKSQNFFSSGFLQDVERLSPFRFKFLRKRQERLAGRQGLYPALFDAFVEAPEDNPAELPSPYSPKEPGFRAEPEPVAALTLMG
jgi:hypothetical protein